MVVPYSDGALLIFEKYSTRSTTSNKSVRATRPIFLHTIPEIDTRVYYCRKRKIQTGSCTLQDLHRPESIEQKSANPTVG